jgi:chaperonin GroEL (HSP60 family)
VAVLSGEFLRGAEKLMALKIHPQAIIRGWRKAVVVARAALEAAAMNNSTDKGTLSIHSLYLIMLSCNAVCHVMY